MPADTVVVIAAIAISSDRLAKFSTPKKSIPKDYTLTINLFRLGWLYKKIRFKLVSQNVLAY